MEFRVCPGVMRHVAVDKKVVVSNTEIVDADRPAKGDDLTDGIIGSIRAVPGVHMQFPLQPYAVAKTGDRRYRTELRRRPWVAVGWLPYRPASAENHYNRYRI